jgi:Chitobiase/beta-hexosaminidase C-terminal domain
MKSLLCTLTFFVAAIVPAYAITVKTPASGSRVTSPFQLTASTTTCSSKPAASMGYSIDSGATTITSTSFTAAVSATSGAHILHVKCWGTKVNEDLHVNITVVPSTVSTPVLLPIAGTYKSKQSVTLSDATPGATIYYTTNGAAPTLSSPKYSSPIPISATTVIEAIAVVAGKTTSGFARGDYVITPPSTPPVVPASAIVDGNLQLLDTWHFNHDAGTPGTAVGESGLFSTPSRSGSARQFASSYTNAGGEIYSVSYANDTASSNFLYDGWVWIEAGSSIANLEMDSNQVTSNGETVIYAFQCSGYSKKWEYSGAGAKWVSSSQPCDLSSWQTNVWHHVQISYSRDDSGNVTYKSVWLDGAEQAINATVPSSFALGWQVGVVQTQFQLDGLGTSGANTVYLDNLTISRW